MDVLNYLHSDAEEYGVTQEVADAVADVQAYLYGREVEAGWLAVTWDQDDEGHGQGRAQLQPFFCASSLEAALRWQCERVDHAKMKQIISTIYDSMSITEDGHGSVMGDDSATTRDGTEEGLVGVEDDFDRVEDEVLMDRESPRQESSGKKRRKKAQGPMKKKKPLTDTAKFNAVWKLAQATGNDLDDLENPGLGIPQHLQPYTQYLMGVGNIGLSLCLQMACNGFMVGGVQAFEDMAQAIALWRSQSGTNSTAWASLSQPTASSDNAHDIVEPQLQALESVSMDSDGVSLEGRITSLKQRLRRSYFTVTRRDAKEIMDAYQHRYTVSEMWQLTLELADAIRQRDGTMESGRSVITYARDEIFEDLYGGSRQNAKKENTRFKHLLERGKRWYLMKEHFGVGILLLVPRTFPRSWFESQLSIEHVTTWFAMLDECNGSLRDMSMEIQWLVGDLLQSEGRNSDTLRLEQVTDWSVIPREDLSLYLRKE